MNGKQAINDMLPIRLQDHSYWNKQAVMMTMGMINTVNNKLSLIKNLCISFGVNKAGSKNLNGQYYFNILLIVII